MTWSYLMNMFILLCLWLIVLFDGTLKPLNHISIMTERRNAILFTLDKKNKKIHEVKIFIKICVKIFQFQVTLLSKVKNSWTVIYLNRGSLLWMITTLAFENEGRPLSFFECRPLQGWNEPTRCDTICDAHDDMHANTFKQTINNGG